MSGPLRTLSIFGIAVVLASCAQPEKLMAPSSAAAAGSPFDQVGKVTLYPGQPCASQIMFLFRAERSVSTISLAAPMPETRILTEAANRRGSVHVRGKWRRTKQTGCSYVEVKQAEIKSSFW
jgi:hypothetical protein